MNRSTDQIGYLQLLREYPDYRNLYFAHTFSLLGDWMNTIAIFLLIQQITGTSAQAIGGVIILKLLPAFFMGPIAGVVVDRYSRKTIMIVSDLLRAGVVLCVLFVVIYPQAWILYVATAVQIGISSFFEPARSASIPNLVPDRALTTANILGAVTWSAMFTLGSALGGVIIELLGWQSAVLLDGATYLVSAILISRVHLPHRRTRPRSGHLTLRQMTGLEDVIDGFNHIRKNRDVIALILVKPLWGIAGALTLVLTVMGGTEYQVMGSAALGISFLYTVRAIGTGFGPIVARRLTMGKSELMWNALGWSFLWASVWYAAFASTGVALLAAACVLIAHLGGSTIWVFSTVLLQQTVPDEFRGRVFAAEMGLFTLTGSASLWMTGWLMDERGVSPRNLVFLLSALILPIGLAWLIGPGRRRTTSSGETSR